MLDEISAYQLRLYSLDKLTEAQLRPQFQQSLTTPEAERNENLTHYVSFHDVLTWLLRQFSTLNTLTDGYCTLIDDKGDIDPLTSLSFSIKQSDGVGLENIYWLSLTPGQKLGWHIGPNEHLQRNPWLLMPALLATLLTYDWFGGDRVRFMGGNLPKELWYQAMYLYMDLMGLKNCPEPRTNSRQGELVRMLPELFDDEEWQQELRPSAAKTNVINAPIPGTLERRERLIMGAGFSTIYETDEPLVWQKPYFQRLRQLESYYLPKPSVSDKLLAVQQQYAPMLDSSETPVANVDGLKHLRFTALLKLLQAQRVAFVVKEQAGVGVTHLIRQVAHALVSGTRLINLGKAPSFSAGRILHPEIEHAYRNGGIVVIQQDDEYLAKLLFDQVPLLSLSDPSRHNVPVAGHPDFRVVFELTTRQYEFLMHQLALPQIAICTLFVGHDVELYTTLLYEFAPNKKAMDLFQTFLELLPEVDVQSLHFLATLNIIKQAAPERVTIGLEAICRHLGWLTAEQENDGGFQELWSELHILNAKSTAAKPSKAVAAKQAEAATPAEKQQHLAEVAATKIGPSENELAPPAPKPLPPLPNVPPPTPAPTATNTVSAPPPLAPPKKASFGF